MTMAHKALTCGHPAHSSFPCTHPPLDPAHPRLPLLPAPLLARLTDAHCHPADDTDLTTAQLAITSLNTGTLVSHTLAHCLPHQDGID